MVAGSDAQNLAETLRRLRGGPAETRAALAACAAAGDRELAGLLAHGGDDARAAAFWALARGSVDDATRRAVLEALNAQGPAVAADALTLLRSGLGDDGIREGCLDLLACCGARTEPVLDALLDAFAANPIGGAWRLAAYGDARVVPMLSELLDECLADETANGETVDDFLAGIEVGVLADAIAQLGGVLTPAQRGALRAGGFLPEDGESPAPGAG